MEPAKIDWKRLEWSFVEDKLYEHINAPKWVDFLSLDHSLNDHADEAWFCKPDCKHPKTAEDFLRSKTPPSKKGFSPGYVSENLPSGDKIRRDAKIKRRVPALFNQESENQNPNLFTPPPTTKVNPLKEAIKSTEEKKKVVDNDDTFVDHKAPSLRSTLSTKNLFAGRPILNQITEFCNELKKLAIRAKERENAENLIPKESEEVVEKTSCSIQALAESDTKEKERKPLLEVSKAERIEGMCVKGKQQRKKRPDEAENMPVTLDLENLKHKREGSLQQIRTNPPSPQCFSVARGFNKPTPSKAPKSRLMERGILGEIEQNKEIVKESPAEKSRSTSIVDGRETKALDMFWFLKPCTLSG
ncbi:hypothetical protein AAZX31_08G153600 [Glycine max]|uniref:uncharacterized protein LOC100820089 n=1 Tax=Glycine max TaxID=3847 RepID=UPI0001876AC5|nr:uncharacterized protein LOC100820089 [Glycine max]XP_040873585.1 uncharacterized protein LOC100820089 isoform X1 [Glycine max]XP_040873586.1 uncharacterized protein LOC100820089 isoform X1 [Glycine max]XP_040873587.1 uncharacterized protein LOC100820089 isoform X1 [Glycine max]XP_040873589.1 uncharacterized protein LOC100820089 isoform X1 [Glycine max]KAG4399017.1 hypothetical protein GLYMA_08G155000v4 [Glycine max]KAG5025569.1 hypothetical protein JHK86_021483 [Glycine max]KAG5136737.1 h|eukprot:XP_006585355.1 uncharacterized protein LOC100820089 isoform X1 [Glycine max]